MRALLFALIAVAVGALLRYSGDQDVPTLAAYPNELAAIADQVSRATIDDSSDDAAWSAQVRNDLRTMNETVGRIDSLARVLESGMTTDDACVPYAPPLGALMAQIGTISAAIEHRAGALETSVGDRIARLEIENSELGWRGLRGTREYELNRLYAFAHDIDLTRAVVGTELCRLQGALVAYFSGRRCT
jgi:hypothetical protein